MIDKCVLDNAHVIILQSFLGKSAFSDPEEIPERPGWFLLLEIEEDHGQSMKEFFHLVYPDGLDSWITFLTHPHSRLRLLNRIDDIIRDRATGTGETS